MVKSNKFLLMYLISLIVLINSCTGSGNSPSITNPDLYKGTQGLEIEVISNLPERIFENEPFEYVVKLTNNGVYDIKNGVLTLNVEKDYLSVDGKNIKKENINLQGKEIFQTLDDFEIKQFTIKSGNLDQTSQTHETLILTSACYDFMAKAFADICIDSDPHDINPTEKECKTKKIDLSKGQGGPVLISLIEPRMIMDDNYLRPQFKIHVKNSGRGTVLQHGREDTFCSSGNIAREQYNKVILSELSFSTFKKNDFDCSPEPLRLKGNEDVITCTLKTGKISKDITNYLTPITLELKYGYLISNSDMVKIEKILTS
ncbi:hypothetical protein HN451_10335 [archaeon]|nr:hypothetical protein [archaeon]